MTNKYNKQSYHKTIAISHGSGGISKTEVKISEFFIEKGFQVQIFDHFSSLRIKKLNWGYSRGLIDNHDVSLLNLVRTIDAEQCLSKYHLGLSLGGYIGLNNTNLFERIFCCYPGILPILKAQFMVNINRIRIFEGTNDMWTKLPPYLRKLFKLGQVYSIPQAYHSFMSFNKNKNCEVYSYKFKELLVCEETLSKIQLKHSSLAKNGTSKKIISKNKTDQNGIKIVLNNIINEVTSG